MVDRFWRDGASRQRHCGHFQKSIAGIQHLFKSCEEVHPNFKDARDIFWILRCVYYVANHKDRVANHADLLSPTIVSNTRAGFDMSLEDVAWAERHWVQLYQEFQEFFADIDLFIVPGNAIPPFLVDEGIPTKINGVEMENYMDPSLVRSALTLTGHPVLALPCGIDHVGMPFGFQIVGKRRGDLKLLQAAAALEKKSVGSTGFALRRLISALIRNACGIERCHASVAGDRRPYDGDGQCCARSFTQSHTQI